MTKPAFEPNASPRLKRIMTLTALGMMSANQISASGAAVGATRANVQAKRLRANKIARASRKRNR